MGNWETLGKHVCTMNVSGKRLPCLVDVYRPEFSPSQQALGGLSLTLLRGNLLVCQQDLSELQIPFSVHPLTLVKLGDVVLQQLAY